MNVYFFRKIKLFYSLMKSTILLSIAIDSLYLILLMYFFILVCFLFKLIQLCLLNAC
ncbi:unnamed protein product [Aphis gossypii]|uniref:Uncharacterized protein n=1 Tax=Aphis gossypii TaxID=80765 RepID=A0A9P0JDL0_APHGO|nr:unnamed protein product [Aphis gossypii]